MDETSKPTTSETEIVVKAKKKAPSRRERIKPEDIVPPPRKQESKPNVACDEPKEVMDPSLGEHDVRAQIVVRLTTRHGAYFINEDVEVLGGLLDPSNRGHMAKIVEVKFARMSQFVIRGFNTLLEEQVKESAPEKGEDSHRFQKRRPNLLDAIKVEEGKPSLPPRPRPSSGFVPPIPPPGGNEAT